MSIEARSGGAGVMTRSEFIDYATTKGWKRSESYPDFMHKPGKEGRLLLRKTKMNYQILGMGGHCATIVSEYYKKLGIVPGSDRLVYIDDRGEPKKWIIL